MKPIERLKTPVTDIDCIKAIDVIIPIMDQIITAVHITKVWLAVIESKAVRNDKLDHYMEQMFEAMRVKKKGPTAAEDGEEVVAAVEVSDSGAMIMDVTLAVTERLSENQLDKAKEFFLLRNQKGAIYTKGEASTQQAI